MGLFGKKSKEKETDATGSQDKTFGELMKDYERAMLHGTPQEEAAILDRAAKIAKSDLEQFQLSTKIAGFKERYS